MTIAWNASPGIHAVQFYERERFLCRAIVSFFAQGIERGEPLVMISRRRTFESTADLLAAEYHIPPGDAASRIRFVDAEEVVTAFIEDGMLNPAGFEQSLVTLLDELQETYTTATMWLYGEVVDVLCKAGNHAAAIQIEQVWNAVSPRYRASVLCGYAVEDFDDDVHARQIREVCREHTHVVPAEGFTDAPDDRARFEHVAFLQQRARALERLLAHEPAPAEPVRVFPPSTVYVIDDDPSIRQSLARLLASVDVDVRTFASAEAFLSEVDETAIGCLLLDIQLAGMSGQDLHSRLVDAEWSLPVIAMSGSHDDQVEKEALRLGARAFLRKPFDASALLDAIALALS